MPEPTLVKEVLEDQDRMTDLILDAQKHWLHIALHPGSEDETGTRFQDTCVYIRENAASFSDLFGIEILNAFQPMFFHARSPQEAENILAFLTHLRKGPAGSSLMLNNYHARIPEYHVAETAKRVAAPFFTGLHARTLERAFHQQVENALSFPRYGQTWSFGLDGHASACLVKIRDNLLNRERMKTLDSRCLTQHLHDPKIPDIVAFVEGMRKNPQVEILETIHAVTDGFHCTGSGDIHERDHPPVLDHLDMRNALRALVWSTLADPLAETLSVLETMGSIIATDLAVILIDKPVTVSVDDLDRDKVSAVIRMTYADHYEMKVQDGSLPTEVFHPMRTHL